MKKLTVTIGIPAYNEQNTISDLLLSILKQRGNNFILSKVIVASDGSSDRTVSIAKRLSKKHPIIKVINGKKRLRKTGRLNQIHKLLSSDILIIIDADTLPVNQFVIANIVDQFSTDSKVGLVAGRDVPFPANNFFERIAVTCEELWYQTRISINDGDSVHNHHGCISALTKALAKKTQYPIKIYGEDEYLYLLSKKLNFKFKNAPKAQVYYHVANNLNDYLIQNSRFLQTENLMKQYFGQNAYSGLDPNTLHKIRGLIRAFVKYPLTTPFAVILQVVLRVVKYKYQQNHASSSWTTVNSTKIKYI